MASDNVTVDGDIIAEDIIADTVSANLIGDVTGSANTVRDAVQSNIKELGQLTKVITNDNANIGCESKTDLLTLTSDNLTVDGDIIAETVNANIIGDITGEVTGSANTVRDAVQSNIKELGQLTKVITNDNANIGCESKTDLLTLTSDNLTVDGDIIAETVNANIIGDITGDVNGNVTGNLNGNVESGEWRGTAIANTKLAVRDAIQNIAVMDLANESLPGSADSGETNVNLTNKLTKAENDITNLRNTVESLVLAMNQLIKAFE